MLDASTSKPEAEASTSKASTSKPKAEASTLKASTSKLEAKTSSTSSFKAKASTSSSEGAENISIEEILISPVAKKTNKKSRGAQKAQLITASPYKDELEAKQTSLDKKKNVKQKKFNQILQVFLKRKKLMKTSGIAGLNHVVQFWNPQVQFRHPVSYIGPLAEVFIHIV